MTRLPFPGRFEWLCIKSVSSFLSPSTKNNLCCHGNLSTAHPPTLCCHQDLWEAPRVEKTHSQLSPFPKRSLDQVGYPGERANHCSGQKELEGQDGWDQGWDAGAGNLQTCQGSHSKGQGSRIQAWERLGRSGMRSGCWNPKIH